MQRTFFTLAFGGVLLLLAGCGGGASNAPGPNPNPGGGNGNQQNSITIAAPTVDQPRASHFVPDQLNLTTAATDAELRNVLDKYGFTLVTRRGDIATVRVHGNLDAAASELRKEYVVSTVDKINVLEMPVKRYDDRQRTRGTSVVPVDPMYGDFFTGFGFQSSAFGLFTTIGQGWMHNSMGFPGAWDLGLDPTVAAIPVKIAIIDAGFHDMTTPPNDIDPAQLDAANSGSVTGAGNFTAGFPAATWDLTDRDYNGTIVREAIRDTGGQLLGMLLAGHNSTFIRGFDFSGDSNITPDEVFNEGIQASTPTRSTF